MKDLERFIFIALVAIGLSPFTANAQCPSGNCSRYYWNPFGLYNYSTPCANGKCATKKTEAPKPAEPESVEVKPFCEQVIDLINAQRKALGLPPFSIDKSLCNGCESHSRYMRSYGFGHAYGAGRECIAYGVATPESVVRLWLNSSGHRAIILGSGNRIGVGFSGTFWTLRVR